MTSIFAGNVEGHQVFSDSKADVVVCDGFVGNVVLKRSGSHFTILLKKRKHQRPIF
jgi:phosphate acyltransferase